MTKTLKIEFEIANDTLNTKFTCNGMSDIEVIGVVEKFKNELILQDRSPDIAEGIEPVTPIVTSDVIENWWYSLDKNIQSILVTQYCPQYRNLNIPLLELEKIYVNEYNKKD